MEMFVADVRYALRTSAKNPAASITIIVVLALAIGGSTAVFTVADAMLLKPLPYGDPSRLVEIETIHKADGSQNGFTLNRYDLVRDQAKSLQVAVLATDSMNLSGTGEPEQVVVNRVSPNFFSLLEFKPAAGRWFTDQEGTAGGAPSIVISYALWTKRFGGNQSALGTTVNLDSEPATIIGVLPANARFPFAPDAEVWSPRYFELTLFPTARLRQGTGYLTAIGRLAPGATLASASAEMHVLDRAYTAANPAAPDAGSTVETRLTGLQQASTGNWRARLLLLLAAVGVLLLIACANAASLLLSRALARGGEIAVRMAIGAGRRRIIAQLLTEGIVLAVIAGTLGIGLSMALVKLFTAFNTDTAFSAVSLVPDLRVLTFALGVSLFTGFIFGLFPALELSRANVGASLRTQSLGTTTTHGGPALKSALVVAQVALSLVLLIGAGLLLRSIERMTHSSPGFDSAGLMSANISLPTAKFAKAPQQVAFFGELLRRVSAIPGVQSAAISNTVPLAKKRITPMLPEGQPEVPLVQRPFIVLDMISPHYFETLRAPIIAGRAFTDSDVKESAQVVIVNQAFARKFWPNESAVGKHVAIGRLAPSEIVGVSANIKNNGVGAEADPEAYVPFAQISWSNMYLLVRAAVPPATLIPQLRKTVNSLDPDQAVASLQTGEDIMSAAVAQPRLVGMLLGAFSILAFTLAIVGFYGLLAYSVAQRRQELAIRICLGAERENIVRLIFRQGLRLVVSGIVIGLIGAIAATKLLATMLYKVGRFDALTFTLAALLFFASAALACYLPARRATRVNPLAALRS